MTKTLIRDAMSESDRAALETPTGHGRWSSSDLLLATAVDALHVLIWQQTQIHGKKKLAAPEPIARPGVRRKSSAGGADQHPMSTAALVYLTDLRERRRARRGD